MDRGECTSKIEDTYLPKNTKEDGTGAERIE
jgi:hypothetical protein